MSPQPSGGSRIKCSTTCIEGMKSIIRYLLRDSDEYYHHPHCTDDRPETGTGHRAGEQQMMMQTGGIETPTHEASHSASLTDLFVPFHGKGGDDARQEKNGPCLRHSLLSHSLAVFLGLVSSPQSFKKPCLSSDPSSLQYPLKKKNPPHSPAELVVVMCVGSSKLFNGYYKPLGVRHHVTFPVCKTAQS